MIAVNASTPNMPRLLIVKVAPEMSAGVQLVRLRALGQFLALLRDLAERQLVGVADHRGDDGVFDRHRQRRR